MKHDQRELAPPTATVTYILEDPESLTDSDKAQYTLVGSRGQNLLEIALDADINIEHACGGVCACSTCHAYINEGQGSLSEPEEDEEDRV
ncbi:MAG: 2Fe-2S iron-sulfur cluster-binding protein, partial [Phycisphaeraceae bacterium]|nr:2Fe-2S iron-sulfur cluster-binding protein [Phycisphaeraceae bacterium]